MTSFTCRTCGASWTMGPTRDHKEGEQCHRCAAEGNANLNAHVNELEQAIAAAMETDWTPGDVEFEESDGTKRRLAWESGDDTVGMAPGFQPDDNEWERIVGERDRYRDALGGLYGVVFRQIFPGASMESDEQRIAQIPSKDLREALQSASAALAKVKP